MKPIGIFGGTFDPIHYGHLRAALELQQILDLAEVRFIPCQTPVHKQTVFASAEHRLAMLKLATKGINNFVVDPREVYRDTPSYMIETLQSLKQDFPDTPLLLIMGNDAFSQLPTWQEWQSLLDYCHILVVLRPGYRLNLDAQMQNYYDEHVLTDASELELFPSPAGKSGGTEQFPSPACGRGVRGEGKGGIYVQTVTALDISATMIRAQISANLNPKFLLPDPVLAYIVGQNLYLNSR